MLNLIHNEDCHITMDNMMANNIKVDLILTSPPYNTSRVYKKKETISNQSYNSRYMDFNDSMSDEDYIEWTVKLFNKYDDILYKDGVILYNLSYSSEKPFLMYKVIGKLLEETNFVIADTITWKKKSALPNNRSSNKLTRIVEPIFVFCRSEEIKTFKMNKKVLSVVERTKQKNYENLYNYIEAKNNDGKSDKNKATFSSELCEKLLRMYVVEGSNTVVYDSFMGTGTTAVACKRLGISYIGSELSTDQCIDSELRVKETLIKDNLN
jgi:DNA modification methylase